MNTGVTRYEKAPSSSALRGKWIQRNFWIGDSMVDSRFGLRPPSVPGNASRFLSA